MDHECTLLFYYYSDVALTKENFFYEFKLFVFMLNIANIVPFTQPQNSHFEENITFVLLTLLVQIIKYDIWPTATIV